jgi:hypothetical protein
MCLIFRCPTHPYKFSQIQSLHHVSVSQEGHAGTACRFYEYRNSGPFN